MSPARPTPQTIEDSRIHFAEHSRTRDVPVIVSPTSNDGVERCYQDAGRRLFVGLAARFPPAEKNLSIEGGLRAYHVACEYQSGLGLASPPVAQRLRRVS